MTGTQRHLAALAPRQRKILKWPLVARVAAALLPDLFAAGFRNNAQP